MDKINLKQLQHDLAVIDMLTTGQASGDLQLLLIKHERIKL